MKSKHVQYLFKLCYFKHIIDFKLSSYCQYFSMTVKNVVNKFIFSHYVSVCQLYEDWKILSYFRKWNCFEIEYVQCVIIGTVFQYNWYFVTTRQELGWCSLCEN